MTEKTRGKWVLFTVGLELLSEEPAGDAEMRGYNWLARRLNPVRRSGKEIDIISFHTVPVSESQLCHRQPGGDQPGGGHLYGYAVRLREMEPGDPPPVWLINALQAGNGTEEVRYRGITNGRAATLSGRP
jgi:hypothetical protein